MTGSDDELLARLRAADPAAGLRPVDPSRVDRLVEDVMSTELTTRPGDEESRETGTRHRSPLTWLVAAAAVLVIAGAGMFVVRALTDDGGGGAPVADPATPTVTHLSVAAGSGMERCTAPTAAAIGTADLAFDGTVTRVDDGQVTMAPTHWYAGEPTDQVVVAAPTEQLQRLASAVALDRGGRYLIAAFDGKVALCGLSAAYDDDLAALYQQAFG